MVTFKNTYYLILIYISLLAQACIEPFEVTTVDFESALVVEATLTNELKQQEVFITRTFKFEEESPTPETNATVEVKTANNTYEFIETTPGVYTSTEIFAAKEGETYQLFINTLNSGSYQSASVAMPKATTIEQLRAERITNDNGEDGIAIRVDSFDPTASASTYRYTYEETYKIVAPNWTSTKLVNAADGGCNMVKSPKQEDEEICYATVNSNTIILTNTTKLEEDRVSNFLVRFLNRDNYIISHRYSILVRQLVESPEAYSFYETLNELSNSESLFSETQPGLLAGNIGSTGESNETIIGYFDVVSVSERRIFFNYSDFYSNESLPPYVDPCIETAPVLSSPSGDCVLQSIFEVNAARYTQDNASTSVSEGPFLIVPRVCGDCTVLGKTEIPEFWVE